MTALERYVRLEAVGLWREHPERPPREVVVAFGKSSLVLKDLADRPLGHWSLAGIDVLGHEDGATVYSMTADGAETLAIRDRDMVEAIAAVSRPRPLPARPPRRGPPLLPLALVAVALLAAAGVAPLLRVDPDLLVPPERAAELGDRMLIALIERHGAPCAEPAGTRALGRLAGRLDPEAPPRLRVIELGRAPAAALPGRTVLIDREIATRASPEEVAGWAALALGRDPAAALLADAGLLADLRYLLTGDFSETALARAATAAARPPRPEETQAALLRLQAARLDPGPLLAALGAAGMPAGGLPTTPALDDQDRVALQGICG